jgi:hypothetical protein
MCSGKTSNKEINLKELVKTVSQLSSKMIFHCDFYYKYKQIDLQNKIENIEISPHIQR